MQVKTLKTIYVTLILLSCFNNSFGYEKSDTFIIQSFADSVKVLAPAAYHPELNAIIENKTLVQLIGKIETGKGRVVGIVSIAPTYSRSVKLNIKKGERLYFIPLAPAFQAVELVIGRKAYEIPPKRKSI
ncbi:MAG: hypothetical protein ISR65_05735 [Bacteriovoracaceae bacterium]|nr:hypothetical protein [Bacteriovoracaceae bacterium]